MVEFEDGAVIAQLGTPGYEAADSVCALLSGAAFTSGGQLDFEKLTKISFEVPDMETFRGLSLAYEAGPGADPCPPCSTLPMRWRWPCS